MIEIDAALDIAGDLGYISVADTHYFGEMLIRCFKILTGLILAINI